MTASSYNQRTLKSPARCEGVGLHSGAKVTLVMRPSAADSGIVFVRTDLPGKPSVPAKSEFVVDTALATSLGRGEARVSTVEHLLAALCGLGIDNVRVELDGPEVPIMDGSAAPFAQLVQEAGVRVLDAPKRFLVIKKTVTVTDGDKEATLSPSSRFRIDCEVDFKHPVISDQAFGIELSDRSFSKEIARARTFGFLKDVEKLKAIGLARGGSLENAIVIDEFSILNPEGLRYPDEFVRHKLLDAIGDLSLFGQPVIGHFRAVKGGHALHHKLVRQVLQDASQYEIVRARQPEMDRLALRLPELDGSLEPLVA